MSEKNETILCDGCEKAVLTKQDLARYLGSSDLAKRAVNAARRGLPGWVKIVRDGRPALYSAASVRRVGERIASGELPPPFSAAGKKEGAK